MAKPLSKPKSLKAQITRTSLVAAATLPPAGPGRPSPIARWQNGPVRPRPQWALRLSHQASSTRRALTMNCGRSVPRRWLQAAVPSTQGNVAARGRPSAGRAFQAIMPARMSQLIASAEAPVVTGPTARDARLSMRP